MLRILTIALAATTLAAPFSMASSQERVDRRAPMLICAGGVTNNVQFIPGNGVTTVEVTFAAAPQGWEDSDGTIPAGTCTWRDRALNADEPRKLRMSLPMKGKSGFNPRSLFIPGQSPVTRAAREYRINLSQIGGGLLMRVNERREASPGRRPTSGWTEIGRINLSEGSLYQVATTNLGDAFVLGRITVGPPQSEGIDLTSDNLEVRR